RFTVELPGRALGMKSHAQLHAFFESLVLVAGWMDDASKPDPSVDVAFLTEMAKLSDKQYAMALGSDKEMDRVGLSRTAIEEWRARILLAQALLTERKLVLINLDAPGMGAAFASMRERFSERKVLLCTERTKSLHAGQNTSFAAVVGADG